MIFSKQNIQIIIKIIFLLIPLENLKKKLLKRDKNITKILLIDDFRYIMLLEGEKYEYILIYSKNNEKSNIKIDFGFDKKIFKFLNFIWLIILFQ